MRDNTDNVDRGVAIQHVMRLSTTQPCRGRRDSYRNRRIATARDGGLAAQPMTPSYQLVRCAYHESGHACAAASFSFPLRSVHIREDGCGLTSYTRLFGPGDCELWTITALAGPVSESYFFGDAASDADMRAIKNMMWQLRIDWNGDRLEEFRCQARLLVERERSNIRALANELLQHRRMTGDEIAAMLPCNIPVASWCA